MIGIIILLLNKLNEVKLYVVIDNDTTSKFTMVRYHGYVLELIVVPAVIDDTVVARILIVVPARG